MRVPLVLLLLTLCLPAGLISQQRRISGLEHSSRVILMNDRYFDGNSLWGYMNGGADLYLEYGFRALRVQDLVLDSQEIRLEIFSMEDLYASRALYSVLTDGITDSSWNNPWSFNPYQVQIVLNECYINVINYTGSGRGLKACIEVSELVGHRFSRLKIDTPPPLQGSKGQWQAFFGPLGCRSIAPELDPILEGVGPIEAWVSKDVSPKAVTGHISIPPEQYATVESRLPRNGDKFGWSYSEGMLRLRWSATGEQKRGEPGW